ncbi:RHS repeat-associated core domain-containing protein [Pedococcus dokdonensis]|uniref:RHS repeat-associated core domain-containing protein n=1 Tax=Pedococcus dokdonensis TaxID=443156 RepID=A0A1H0L3A6_9MICO|nr:RHS repeat-associated core domain-containing protein [Pedococcus dokdonensis]SDO62532.1 RHS repeat-associated core domain-containing protein [Pedococcus dokdonensis]
MHDPDDITGYDVSDAAIGYDRSYAYDGAGRLASVADHTASDHGADLDASPCVVRAYTFDNNGRRKTLTTATHSDGDCAGTTGVTSTSASFDNYDTADRPTLGQGGVGQYVYDALGRQTALPAVDTPDYATDTTAGGITLGYFDDDLPRSVAQTVAGVTTSTVFTLDAAGRRSSATTTTGTATSTLVRHYADGSDNPAWTDKDGIITRYAESIGGDLGLTLAADGSADLTLANLHGDVVTTVPISAAATNSDAAAGIDGWSDFTEYGAPRTGSSTTTTGGSLGYGWLGAKQRSTTTETAGLTLMGDRLYNAVSGRFTSLDPEPGGNATAYAYPNDPINMYDLDGHWSVRKAFWKGVGFFSARQYITATGYASKFDGRGVRRSLWPSAAGNYSYEVSAKQSSSRWGGSFGRHAVRAFRSRAFRFGARAFGRTAGWQVTAVATGLDYYHSRPKWRPRQHLSEMRSAWGKPVNAAFGWATRKFWSKARGAY